MDHRRRVTHTRSDRKQRHSRSPSRSRSRSRSHSRARSLSAGPSARPRRPPPQPRRRSPVPTAMLARSSLSGRSRGSRGSRSSRASRTSRPSRSRSGGHTRSRSRSRSRSRRKSSRGRGYRRRSRHRAPPSSATATGSRPRGRADSHSNSHSHSHSHSHRDRRSEYAPPSPRGHHRSQSRSRSRSPSHSQSRGHGRSRSFSRTRGRSQSQSRSHSHSDSFSGRYRDRGRRLARPRRGDKPGRPRDYEYERGATQDEDYDMDERDDSDDSAGHDDTIGSYDGKPGDYIASRYKVLREAGLGTFGRVLECLDKKRDLVVAIKVVRKVDKYSESAKIEANILQAVNDQDVRNESLCVRMFKWFEYKGHICMVFERLGCSLYDYLKTHDYQPFPLRCIRAFAWQLLTALEYIHSIKLIHTDLKPENILLVDDDEEGRVPSPSPSSTSSYSSPNGKRSRRTRVEVAMTEADAGRLCCRPPASCAVKLIDFGGATYEEESKSSIINTRQYRSPEVILGLGWSFPSDIWSAGCIIAELYIGELLFATHDNLEHLALIERAMGRLPSHMTTQVASHATKFFRDDRLRWPEAAATDDSVEHVRRMRSLDQILRPEDAATGLLELLQLMLVLDPENRITAKEALHHRFFDGFSRHDLIDGGIPTRTTTKARTR